jgi:hypothetical protein
VTQARHKGKKARLPCDPGKTRGKDGPSAMWHVVVFWIFAPVLKFPVRRGLNLPCTRFRHTTNRAYVAFPLRRRKRAISFFLSSDLRKAHNKAGLPAGLSPSALYRVHPYGKVSAVYQNSLCRVFAIYGSYPDSGSAYLSLWCLTPWACRH